MRKLDKRAKRGIVLFAVCCLLTAGGIAACMVLVMNARSASWQLAAGATVYDNVYTPVTLEEAGAVQDRGGGEYTLYAGSGVWDLGTSTVSCDSTGDALDLFGGMYCYEEDGSVVTLEEHSRVEDLTDTAVYRLDTNRYVVVGRSITTESGILSTDTGYLYLIIDSAGNARAVNREVSIRLLSDEVIHADGMVWSLEDDVLRMGDNSIELGSTRDFISEGGELYSYVIRGGDGGDGGAGGTGAGVPEELMQSLASFHIEGAKTTSTSATLDVSMYDPFNYYAVGELWLYETFSDASGNVVTDAATVSQEAENDNLTLTKMSITPSDDSALFTGLKPNKQYSVILGCYDENGDYTQKDYTTFTTSAMDTYLNIREITWYSLSLDIKIDPVADTPQDVYALVYTQEEPELGDVSGQLNTIMREGVALSEFIGAMQSESGTTCDVATRALINEEEGAGTDESRHYVVVLVAGLYDGNWQVLSSQVVRNPYYGMSIWQMENEGEEGGVIIRPDENPANP